MATGVNTAVFYSSHFYISNTALPLVVRLAETTGGQLVFDPTWDGDHKLYGTTKIQISDTEQQPTDVAVVVLDGISFLPIRKVWSRDGVWRVKSIKAGSYLVTAIDRTGSHNAVSWGIQQSVPMSAPESTSESGG